jgi:hypothetical protein
MNLQIEPYHANHLAAIIHLSLRAWTPVFDLIQTVIEVDVYREFYPNWRVNQQKVIEDVCAAEDTEVWVAVNADSTVGFVAVKFDSESRMGKIYMIAVDLDM